MHKSFKLIFSSIKGLVHFWKKVCW